MMTCRECGCTEYQCCVYDDGASYFRCYWVEPDLCSFCQLRFPIEDRAPVCGVDVVTALGGLL